MSAGSLVLILVSVCISALAQISFKLGLTAAQVAAGRPDLPLSLARAVLSPQVILGLGLYGVGTLFWLSALSRVEVSQAYPFVGLGFVLTAVLGWLIFGDDLGTLRLLGIAVVIAGIVIISIS